MHGFFYAFRSMLRRLSFESFHRDSRLRQTANVNLYHVTKFPLIFRYFPFTLYCFYTKISQFYANCNQRNRTGLFFICLIWFWEILNLSLTLSNSKLLTPVVIILFHINGLWSLNTDWIFGWLIRLRAWPYTRITCVTHYCFNVSLPANTAVSPCSLLFAG